MTLSVIASAKLDAMLAVLNGDDLYAGLGTDASDPTVEASGTDYARVLVATSTDWDDPADYVVTMVTIGRFADNAVLVDFGTVGAGAWGTLRWLNFYSASSGGSPVASAPLTTPQVTVAGNQVQIPIGNLRVIAKGGTP